MEVIKLGGSLTHSTGLLDSLERVDRRSRGRSVVIVPGGGAFADQVRMAQGQWRFDDRAAHCMAILAMQQMALLLQALRPNWRIVSAVGEIAEELDRVSVVIWSPRVAELDQGGVPASWEVTSDSLAAWLAARLEAAELFLVKAAPLPEKAGLEQLQALGVIDRAFHRYNAQATFTTRFLNPQQL